MLVLGFNDSIDEIFSMGLPKATQVTSPDTAYIGEYITRRMWRKLITSYNHNAKALTWYCQITLFSATMPMEALEIVSKCMTDPAIIALRRNELTLEGTKQFYVEVENEWKLDTLIDLFNELAIVQAVIYCNTGRQGVYGSI
jgi:superfamily II DNA/RNA helicase